MAASELENGGRKTAPPYTSYPSMRNLFASLKANGVPSRIDRSMLKTFSNAVGTQLITGLKFLKLISDDQRPVDAFPSFIREFDGQAWKQHWKMILKIAYPEMFALNLEVISPAEFNESFRKAYGVDGETLDKCTRFFIAAAQDADIPISKYILSNKKPRKGVPRKRTAKAAAVGGAMDPPAANGAASGTGDGGANFNPRAMKPSEVLLSHLKDMEPQTQEAAWVLMKHFTAKNL